MSRKIAYRNLPQLFLKAREDMLRHFRPIITHFGLTEQQWRILRAVYEAEQLEPREICEVCQILSPSLTGVLSRMEDLALVTRTRLADDQRRMSVRLTPKGEQLVEELTPLITEQYRLIEKAFGPKLIKEVYDLMDKFIAAERGPIPQVKLPDRGKVGKGASNE